MPGTWFGLEIAKRGTMAHRKAMDVTGHNIANASTTGYSRQEAVIKPTDPWTLPGLETRMLPGQLGTGSQVTEVRRIRDYYLDVQYRQSGSYEGYWEKKLDMAKRLETVFPEPEGRGIQDVMLNFFNDWQDLNNNPRDEGVVKAVMESGDELSAIFRQMHDQLTAIRDGIYVEGSQVIPGYTEVISGSIDYEVDKVNLLLKKIADISNTIVRVVQNDATPNDLLDERDNYLDELAKMGHIKVEINDDQTLKVYFIDETPGKEVIKIVGGQVVAAQVSVHRNNTDNKYYMFIDDDGNLQGTEPSINLTDMAEYNPAYPGSGQGSVLGLESARIENKKILDRINNLAAAFITEVNNILAGITDDNGNPAPVTFFEGTDASDIRLATIDTTQEKLLGQKAIDVARLRSTTVNIGGQSTLFESYYQGIVAQVGANVDHHSNMLENQQAIGQQIDALRQSVSGVSVDEELTRVIQFQYGYQASARMIAIQDEMLDYLINRIR